MERDNLGLNFAMFLGGKKDQLVGENAPFPFKPKSLILLNLFATIVLSNPPPEENRMESQLNRDKSCP